VVNIREETHFSIRAYEQIWNSNKGATGAEASNKGKI